MYGQMTAGSWIYIGTQGILQGTYETFAPSPASSAVRTAPWPAPSPSPADCGGMGGAQPLAVTLNGGAVLSSTSTGTHLERRVGQALPRRDRRRPRRRRRRWRRGQGRAAGRCRWASSATPPTSSPSCCAATAPARSPWTSSPTRPARTTRCPTCRGTCRSRSGARRPRPTRPVSRRRPASRWPPRCRRWWLRRRGRRGLRLRQLDPRRGPAGRLRQRAFEFPGFVPAYIRPLFCEGLGPFRWAALSGDPSRHRGHRRGDQGALPRQRAPAPVDGRRRRVRRVRGAARPDLLAGLRRAAPRRTAGFNELVRDGLVKAPIVIGRDHLDSGSVASPYRETEGMLDGSDAVADWPLLNALVSTSSGATWVSIHHGGGVGIGRSIHAGSGGCRGRDRTRRRRSSSGCSPTTPAWG
jgi:urocanate hydratase